jgi:hypothetical protein
MTILGGFGLHLVARFATRVLPPDRAKRVVDRMGELLPPLRAAVDAEAYLAELSGSGSCLTRALAVAARWPGGQVVIGGNVGEALRDFAAHAWVENRGIRVGADSSIEIARL